MLPREGQEDPSLAFNLLEKMSRRIRELDASLNKDLDHWAATQFYLTGYCSH